MIAQVFGGDQSVDCMLQGFVVKYTAKLRLKPTGVCSASQLSACQLCAIREWRPADKLMASAKNLLCL